VTTLVLADDHRAVRDGLRLRLSDEPDFDIIGEAADGREALDMVERLQPDVLIVDIVMPRCGGLEVARRSGEVSPRTRVLVLTMYDNEAYVAEALHAGARAYVLKSSAADELVKAIRATAAGQTCIGLPVSGSIVRAFFRMKAEREPAVCEAFDDRELKVMHRCGDGLNDSEIAAELAISTEAAAAIRDDIARKLGLVCQDDSSRQGTAPAVISMFGDEHA